MITKKTGPKAGACGTGCYEAKVQARSSPAKIPRARQKVPCVSARPARTVLRPRSPCTTSGPRRPGWEGGTHEGQQLLQHRRTLSCSGICTACIIRIAPHGQTTFKDCDATVSHLCGIPPLVVRRLEERFDVRFRRSRRCVRCIDEHQLGNVLQPLAQPAALELREKLGSQLAGAQ